MSRLITLILFLTLIGQAPSLAQDSLIGNWEGAINIQDTEITIITHFNYSEEGYQGTIDVPQQGGQDIPLQNISVPDQDSVQLEFMAGPGLAKFRGTIQEDKITGTFHQNNQTFPFELQRKATEEPTPTDATTAQNEQTLTISNDNITLAGTLTLPDQTPSACVILLSGSGAQDRDSNLFGFKLFKQVADHLSENGIAVFRYDDRGVGNSGGNYSKTSRTDHLSDVKAIVNRLQQHNNINSQNIGLLGHSQGGIITGSAAVQYPQDIAFVVLMASPALTWAETVLRQVKNLQGPEATGFLINQQVELQKAIFDTLRGSQKFDSLQKVLEDQIVKQFSELPDSQKQSIQNHKAYASQQAKQQLQAIQQPSYFSFLDYDPAGDLSQINVPVLALYGGKDIQVPADENKSFAQKYLEISGTDYKIKIFEDANHLFQKAESGSVQKYSRLEHEFVDSFLPTLSEWLREQVDKQ